MAPNWLVRIESIDEVGVERIADGFSASIQAMTYMTVARFERVRHAAQNLSSGGAKQEGHHSNGRAKTRYGDTTQATS